MLLSPPSPGPKSPRPCDDDAATVRGRSFYGNTFSVDVLECPKCKGRMKLLAMVTDAKSIRRFLASTDEPLDAPIRAPNREPPFWQSTVLRRKPSATWRSEARGKRHRRREPRGVSG